MKNDCEMMLLTFLSWLITQQMKCEGKNDLTASTGNSNSSWYSNCSYYFGFSKCHSLRRLWESEGAEIVGGQLSSNWLALTNRMFKQ